MIPVLSSGIIPVDRRHRVRATLEPRVLLLRAYGHWDFPKGLVGPGENPLQAAQRELEEETSIREIRFPWGIAFRESALAGGRKIVRYYLGECDSPHVRLPVSPELGRPEHHEYRWVRIDEARSLVDPRLFPILDWTEATVINPIKRSA